MARSPSWQHSDTILQPLFTSSSSYFLPKGASTNPPHEPCSFLQPQPQSSERGGSGGTLGAAPGARPAESLGFGIVPKSPPAEPEELQRAPRPLAEPET